MAMLDWNHDGKKDWKDNYIEYQMYKNMTNKKNESNYSSSSGEGMSTFGAILSMIAGLLMQSIIYTAFEIDVADVPVIVIAVLWVVFSVLAAIVVDKIGL